MDTPPAKKKPAMTEDHSQEEKEEVLTKQKEIFHTILNALFAAAIVCWLLVGAIVLVTALACSGRSAGCGDIFLISAPIVLVIWALTFIYPIAVIVSSVIDFQNKREVSRMHIAGLAIILLLGFIPQIGPFGHWVNLTPNESTQQTNSSTQNIPVQF